VLAYDAVDHVAHAIGFRPGTQRFLHLRVEPLFGGCPTLDHPEVDPPEDGSVPQRVQLAEGDAGVVLVHRYQERANGARVQSVRPFEELDAIHPRQSEVGRDERHIFVTISQPLEDLEPDPRRALGQYPVISTEPSAQRALEGPKSHRIVVEHEQYRIRDTYPPPQTDACAIGELIPTRQRVFASIVIGSGSR
jgi:hypothetical protein